MANEKRLIDVSECPCDGCKAKPCGHPAKCVRFAEWINKTVDAVEVVRCKDCKHRIYVDMGDDIGAVGGCELLGIAADYDCFCSYGERKDGDGNG